MIREVTPAGTYRYYAPQGEILTFDFTTSGGSPVTSSYNVHSDAIGSVRAITDSTGAVVAHYEYSAWGELLPSSSPLSIGFSYLFVGGLEVRWNVTLGCTTCVKRGWTQIFRDSSQWILSGPQEG